MTLELDYIGRASKTAVSLMPLAEVLGRGGDGLERTRLLVGSTHVALGELFSVKGDRTSDYIVIRGGKKGSFRHLGAGWTRGTLRVEGHAGDYVGCEVLGAVEGMQGGVIHITGDVGNHLGDKMRRGMIIVQGHSEDYAGSRLLGGTILVTGRNGENIGRNMQYGSMILLGEREQALERHASNFANCGRNHVTFLDTLATYVKTIDESAGKALAKRRLFRRYVGDRAVAGKGEIWIPS